MSEASPLPSEERLLELIARLRDQPVVVVADLVADRFISGWAERISREAPVLILKQESDTLVPGGGANAVANMRSLGGAPYPIGLVGRDAGGNSVRRELESLGIVVSGIQQQEGLLTPTKTRILGGRTEASRQQIVRVDSGDTATLDATEQSCLVDLIVEALERSLKGGAQPIVAFSDYGYGIATPELHTLLLERLGNAPVRTLVDSRYRLGDYGSLTAATPNQEEAETLVGGSLQEDKDVLRLGAVLREQLGTEALLITRGRRGMALIEAQGSALIPIHGTDQVVDVTGAGDTVIGTFSLALAAGATALEAALLANYAGGIAVMKAGTATVTAEALRQALGREPDLAHRVRRESH